MLGMLVPAFDADGNTSDKKMARNIGDAEFVNPFQAQHQKTLFQNGINHDFSDFEEFKRRASIKYAQTSIAMGSAVSTAPAKIVD